MIREKEKESYFGYQKRSKETTGQRNEIPNSTEYCTVYISGTKMSEQEGNTAKKDREINNGVYIHVHGV